MRASLPALVFTVTLLGGLGALAAAFESQAGDRPGGLTVVSEPAGAQVWLDGRPVGKAPLTQTPPSGSHRLAFRLEGYAPAELGVNWRSDENQTVHQRLQPLSASLSIKEVGKAKLRLGPGIPKPLEGKGPWKLAPGHYELTAVRDKIPAKPKRFELKPGQTLEVALDWPALPSLPPPLSAPRLPLSRPSAPVSPYLAAPPPGYQAPRYNYYQAPRPAYRPSRPAEPLFTPIPATHYEPPAPPPPSYPSGPEPVFTPLP